MFTGGVELAEIYNEDLEEEEDGDFEANNESSSDDDVDDSDLDDSGAAPKSDGKFYDFNFLLK